MTDCWDTPGWQAAYMVACQGLERDRKGRRGKAVEVVVNRWTWLVQGRGEPPINHAQAGGRVDIVIYGPHGEELRVETATGSTQINLVVSDYVAYATEPDPTQNLARQLHIMPYADWQKMLTSYPGAGKLLKIRGNKVNIQSFRTATQPGASLPIRRYLDNWLAHFPTYYDWLESIVDY